jgi:hypothetical protein
MSPPWTFNEICHVLTRKIKNKITTSIVFYPEYSRTAIKMRGIVVAPMDILKRHPFLNGYTPAEK